MFFSVKNKGKKKKKFNEYQKAFESKASNGELGYQETKFDGNTKRFLKLSMMVPTSNWSTQEAEARGSQA